MAMSKKNGPSSWLNDSYTSHGNSTSTSSKPKSRNMNDTPKVKVATMKTQSTKDPMKQGDASGGGSVKQKTTSPGNGSTAKYTKGIMGGKPQ